MSLVPGDNGNMDQTLIMRGFSVGGSLGGVYGNIRIKLIITSFQNNRPKEPRCVGLPRPLDRRQAGR